MADFRPHPGSLPRTRCRCPRTRSKRQSPACNRDHNNDNHRPRNIAWPARAITVRKGTCRASTTADRGWVPSLTATARTPPRAHSLTLALERRHRCRRLRHVARGCTWERKATLVVGRRRNGSFCGIDGITLHASKATCACAHGSEGHVASKRAETISLTGGAKHQSRQLHAIASRRTRRALILPRGVLVRANRARLANV